MAAGGGPLDRLAPIRFEAAELSDLAANERREWWLANGKGGYAGGTVALSLTRRYHGLLIAPVDPPLGRVLVLTKADATLHLGAAHYPLFTNRWGGGAIDPDGYKLLESFHLDGTMPVWRFRCGEAIVEHRIWMEPGADTVYLAWRLEGGAADASLSVTFLANGRDHHGDTWQDGFNPEITGDGGGLTVAVRGRFTLRIAGTSGEIAPRRDWYGNFDLPVERERGLNDRDSHLHIGDGHLPLQPGTWAGYVASLDPSATTDLGAAFDRRHAHDRVALEKAIAAAPIFAEAPGWVLRLVLAADLYRIARPLPDVPDGRSVIAGYPWFGDWGRDTMIALPGLCLATGCFAEARLILETFTRFLDGGMLPNVFPGAGNAPEYNTVDAALWFVEAWRAYVATSGDVASLRRVFPVLASIVENYTRGTRYGIAVDPVDGLLRAGEAGVQLSWMDAKLSDWVVTPRIGKPVEINALWFNALTAMAELADRIGQSGSQYQDAADKAKAGFARFVRPGGRGLYDVIDGPDGNDASLRPNQVFAMSLPASPLDPAQQRAVIEACAPLVTPYGLRSLAPDDPSYRGACTGGPAERDGAYHQGTVWAWLLGHWALAQYRVTGAAAVAQALLAPIADHLRDAGLGQISEIFDGDPPHTPRGCPAQAWSVACVLEAWCKLEHAKKAAIALSARRRRRAPRRS
ncbi:MAG TPA: amylo-alpha-1,6-glucosidase [Stellaceae bacterium]|nr:amylo-alpha-1,6-glucosidase [Stellaceae bacterium]